METKTIVHTKSGAKTTIHPCGACLMSYITSEGREVIFVSKLAKLDGSKAVRGGIPLVFPQFGQPDKSMPQHGFLRTNIWGLDESSLYDTEAGAGGNFVLPLSKVVKSRGGAWDIGTTKYDCVATFTIRITADTLTTKLTIDNTGNVPFDFQILYHTYYKIAGGAALDKNVCYVKGLQGYDVHDKITGDQYEQGSDPISVDNLEVDRVYTPKAGVANISLECGTGDDERIALEASGKVDGKDVAIGCVVWNPYIAKSKATSDFGDEEYHDMICVEPGMIANVPTLEAEKKAEFTQTVTAL
eukprot:CAMPEP_0118719242 /NCGR_PEP_ID=MMETSP0800-20121206/29341_1 /TAXON_ID=210618 ORGANISM="Striatella unipunctata, Strain CCMP2910" /NCGR_SAMPLE_ID=MMETSP0800 /ASSEMBLY_ACC=CAM_ASM_000638 /LENGTH=299 /DNA_ID=CAMNT_0006626539 /DNA_START=462 /DNA_END=1361 /DNA_ORIENTATION=+